MVDAKKVAMNFIGNTRNTVELRIENEAHSLGNMVSEQLLEDKRCLFSAYRVEHPTDNHLFLRVSGDKSYPVRDLLLETLKKIEADTSGLIAQFMNLERRV